MDNWLTPNTRHDENIVMGIDIGSTKVSVMICELTGTDEFEILGIGTSVTSGLSKGQIMALPELVKTIERAIKRAQLSAGINPVYCVINCPQHGVTYQRERGEATIQADSRVIKEKDIQGLLKKTKEAAALPNKTVLHLLASSYSLDGTPVINPVGRIGSFLESEALIVQGETQTVKQLIACIKTLDCQLKGIVIDGLALGEIVLTQQNREKGALIIDIGGQFTKLNGFYDGHLQWGHVFPIGGATITKDIAQCLKVTIPEAERLKIIYGDACLANCSPTETIQIVTHQGKQTIKRRYLCQIIEARIDELLKLIRKEIGDMFPTFTDVQITGGGGLLNGLKQVISQRWDKQILDRKNGPYQHKVNGITYDTALGAILYARKKEAIGYFKPNKSQIIQQFFKF
ncbi:cell division protein FtsA [bacterium]|jgi:cell division protein FtsA|nr:cell division protein FtsA [bacterium]